ncbi:MAG TPA: translocation/assembly module TamB domain-containing protein [Polyangiaceae bacterium]|jgi:translocation and assembly module TamB
MRVLRWAGAGFGTLVVFVLAVVCGVLVHLNTPSGRHLVMYEVNTLLAPSFKGRIRVDRLGQLSVFGLSGTDVTIEDPTGRPVIVATGVRVRVASLDVLRSVLLVKHEPLTVKLTAASMDTLDVRLDTDAKGQLELVDAFAPRTPSPPTPPNPNARGFRIDIPGIAWRHALVHGQMPGAPPIDADIDDFRGSFSYGPDALEGTIATSRIAARRIANGADVDGSLEAHVRDPSDPKARPDARVHWEGVAGGIENSLRASLENDRLDAVLDVPRTEPANIRALWPASPIERPTRAHVEAHGPLTELDVGVAAALGDASLDVRGQLSVGDEKTARLALEARDIDVHQLAASAPTSRLGLMGEVFADVKPDGALSGDVDLRFLGGKVGTNALPPATIRGYGARSAAKQMSGDVALVVDEPGAPTHVDLRAFPKGESSAVDFELVAKSIDLDRVPELHHAARGSLGIFATGQLDVGAMTVEARLDAKGDGLVQGATRVASVSVDGRASGSVVAPQLGVAVRAQGIVAGGYRFTSASVDATGKATAPHVTTSVRGPDTPDVDASADLDLRHGVTIGAARVALARRGEHALVTARRVTLGGGDLRVDEGRIEGLGKPLTADVEMTRRNVRVLATTQGLDLGRVARLANLEKTLEGGTVSLDTDLRLQRRAAQGRLTLDLERVCVGKVQDLNGHVQIALDGRKVGAKVHLDADAVGSVDVDAPNVELGSADVDSLAAWKGAWGAVDVDANGDLAKALALVPPEDLPVSAARGKVRFKAHLARDDDHDFTPDVRFSVSTDQLALAAKTPMARDIDGVLVYPPPPWHIEGIDFIVDARVDGGTGALRFTGQAHDGKGPLAKLDLDSPHLPYAEALHGGAALADRLRTTAFDAHLVIPERGLGEVPPILKQSYVTGRVRADVQVSGPMRTPKVLVTAALGHVAYAGNGPRAKPLDVDLTARYDGFRATASVKARSADREMLDLEAQGDAAIAELLGSGKPGAGGAPFAWKSSVRAHLAGFPMDSIAALDDKLVKGTLSGDLAVVDLHENARAAASLTIDELSVGSFAYKSALIQATANGRIIDGTVRVDQTDGFLEAKVHAPASWGAALAPALDPTEPLDLDLGSKNFRIGALLPFLDGTFDELDGRLDARTHVRLDPKTNTAQASGTIALSRGTVEASAGGGELHDITANLKLAPNGTITLEKLTARGLTGQLQATGSAKLDGTSLQSAKIDIDIPSKSPIPLTAGGTDIGNVDGKIQLTELTSEGGKAMAVKVAVPKMRVALPEGAASNPQPLGEMPKVRIGAHRGHPEKFVLLSIDPPKKAAPPSPNKTSTKLTLEAQLGDVQVTKGTELAVDLDGKVNVVDTGTAQVTGQIHLKRGGVLNVQGKKFTVEDGTVTLVGPDPSNPEVVVKASWTAPDGTIVYAVFDGPLKTGKVTLSSEPTLPQQEIVELLLFGTADGAQAQSPTGTPANSAIGTAGGEAAQPLNHMLGQLGLGAVTANVDTTQASNPRPEVQIQIAKAITLQIAVVLGQPPPGVNPDRTLLTVDWRFLTKWSLASTVGDAGTTIFDLLWQRRY